MHHGSDEQQQRWLPSMATGERRGALSLSEPDAGSDTRNISCRAVRDGDEYVLNGTKAWVTNGERAGIVALAARTEEGISRVHRREGARAPSSRASRSASTSASSATRASRRSRWPTPTTASRPPTSSARPAGACPRSSACSRSAASTSPSRAVGVARAAFDAALAYAQERSTFGKPIAEHQAIQLKLADMATRLEAARLLTRNAAERKAAGLRCDVEAGMAKLFASETALELATESMRIHGGVGYTTELPVERYYRDAPLMVIGEGTNEIQRLVIARGLLARADAARSRLGGPVPGCGPGRAARPSPPCRWRSPAARRRSRRPGAPCSSPSARGTTPTTSAPVERRARRAATTNAMPTSPSRSSGTPITAACWMSGWRSSAFSISAG